MHYTQYGNGKTFCGRSIKSVPATGLDSKVTCGNCIKELAAYREVFPQASNQEDPFTKKPLMLGGAR